VKASLIICLILLSGLLGFVANKGSTGVTDTGNTDNTLSISVDPSGNHFELELNQTQAFTAHVNNGTGPFNYEWQVYPSANLTVTLNGKFENLSSIDGLKVGGQSLNVSYPIGIGEFVSVNIVITDVFGNSGTLKVPFIISNAFDNRSFIFDSSKAIASYIIRSDGNGLYQAINGINDTTALTSTNATYLWQSTINSLSDSNTIIAETGTYPIDQTITGTRGLRIIGANRGTELTDDGVLFKWIGAENSLMFNFSQQYTLNLENIKLYGNNIANVTAILLGGTSDHQTIPFSNTRNCNWSNVDIYNFTNTAIKLGLPNFGRGTDDSMFTNLRISYCGIGIDSGSLSATMNVFSCTKIRGCTTGVLLRESANLHFYDTVWTANTVDIDFATNTTLQHTTGTDILATNCWFEQTKVAIFQNSGTSVNSGVWQFTGCCLGLASNKVLANLTNTGNNAFLEMSSCTFVYPEQIVILPQNSGLKISLSGPNAYNVQLIGINEKTTPWISTNGLTLDLVRGNITGNAGTTLERILGTYATMPLSNECTVITKATLTVIWNPTTPSGGFQLRDISSNTNLTGIITKPVGVGSSVINILPNIAGTTQGEVMQLYTKGDGTIAPEIYTAYITLGY
jgi:hypothetical protein